MKELQARAHCATLYFRGFNLGKETAKTGGVTSDSDRTERLWKTNFKNWTLTCGRSAGEPLQRNGPHRYRPGTMACPSKPETIVPTTGQRGLHWPVHGCKNSTSVRAVPKSKVPHKQPDSRRRSLKPAALCFHDKWARSPIHWLEGPPQSYRAERLREQKVWCLFHLELQSYTAWCWSCWNESCTPWSSFSPGLFRLL